MIKRGYTNTVPQCPIRRASVDVRETKYRKDVDKRNIESFTKDYTQRASSKIRDFANQFRIKKRGETRMKEPTHEQLTVVIQKDKYLWDSFRRQLVDANIVTNAAVGQMLVMYIYNNKSEIERVAEEIRQRELEEKRNEMKTSDDNSVVSSVVTWAKETFTPSSSSNTLDGIDKRAPLFQRCSGISRKLSQGDFGCYSDQSDEKTTQTASVVLNGNNIESKNTNESSDVSMCTMSVCSDPYSTKRKDDVENEDLIISWDSTENDISEKEGRGFVLKRALNAAVSAAEFVKIRSKHEPASTSDRSLNRLSSRLFSSRTKMTSSKMPHTPDSICGFPEKAPLKDEKCFYGVH